MAETEKARSGGFMAKLIIFIIILATIFTIYLSIKLIVTGFTFR